MAKDKLIWRSKDFDWWDYVGNGSAAWYSVRGGIGLDWDQLNGKKEISTGIESLDGLIASMKVAYKERNETLDTIHRLETSTKTCGAGKEAAFKEALLEELKRTTPKEYVIAQVRGENSTTYSHYPRRLRSFGTELIYGRTTVWERVEGRRPDYGMHLTMALAGIDTNRPVPVNFREREVLIRGGENGAYDRIDVRTMPVEDILAIQEAPPGKRRWEE